MELYRKFCFTRSFRLAAEIIGSVDQLLDELKVKFAASRVQLEEGEQGQRHYHGVLHSIPRVHKTQAQEALKLVWDGLEFPVKDYLEASKSKAADKYVMKQETRTEGPWEWEGGRSQRGLGGEWERGGLEPGRWVGP